MSELRQDPVSGEWVYFAANRRHKPYEFNLRKMTPKSAACDCAFCPGHEMETPAALYQDAPGTAWQIRVFENRYPAVHREAGDFVADGFYRNVPGIGRHEVVVDTPDHLQCLPAFTPQHLRKVLEVLQSRLQVLRQDPAVAYVQIFKNCGPEAGASMSHSHWQLIGVPVPGKEQQDALDHGRAYRAVHDRCLFCDILQKEQGDGLRVVWENPSFLVFAPYASRAPFELWILAKTHVSSLADFSGEALGDLSEALLLAARRIAALREGIGYNICFQDVPKGPGLARIFHWYCRLVPRIGAPAGFEYGTGNRINPVAPEAAAVWYRELGEKL